MSWTCKTWRNGCISKTPTCCWQWWGSIGGHIRCSVSVWCRTDLTGDTVVWREETAVQKRKWDKTPNNRCVLQSDPARDSAVMWSGTGLGATPGQAVVDVTWYDARKTHRRGDWTKVPFYSHSCLSLYLSLSHMHAHKHLQSIPFTAVFLALSILSVLPCCRPLSPRFLILSCPFSIPLSLIFFLAPALSRFPPVGCESVTQCRAAGMGAAPHQPPMDR